MSAFKTRDGSDYTPLYLTDINGETCIGCGRCFKVCPQNVMALYGVDDTGEILGIVTDDDEDDFDGELDPQDHEGRTSRLLHRLQRLFTRVSKELSDACSGGRTRGVTRNGLGWGKSRN